MKTKKKQDPMPGNEETKITVRDSFIIKAVDLFANESYIYDVIKSFQKLKYEWMLKAKHNGRAERIKLLSDLHAIENLLLDIAMYRSIHNEIMNENNMQTS